MFINFFKTLLFTVCCLLIVQTFQLSAQTLPVIVVSKNKKLFIEKESGKVFVPFGVNYDHDYDFKLLEFFWNNKKKISKDFSYIKNLGFNTVRIHLQQFIFQENKKVFNKKDLEQLLWLINEAENKGLYLDITGLGRYNGNIPDWYKDLSDKERVEADTFFWKSIATALKNKTNIFCFDIQNEPTINSEDNNGYVGPPFDDKYHYINRHFQNISIKWKEFLINKYNSKEKFRNSWLNGKYKNYDYYGKNGIKVPNIFSSKEENGDFKDFKDGLAIYWLSSISETIKNIDSDRLITLGLCDLNLSACKFYSSFAPKLISPYVDFISFHAYPKTLTRKPYSDNSKDFIESIKSAAVKDKPLVLEEFYPLVPLAKLYTDFIKPAKKYVDGWISFYWGKTIPELTKSDKIRDHIIADWLKYYLKNKEKFIKYTK